MGRKHKYINLVEKERLILEKAYKKGKTHDYRRRCHCILLSADEWTIDELSVFFKVGRQSISKWLSRYISEGLSGLGIRKGRGRKRKLDLENPFHVALVKKSLKKENRGIKQLKQTLEEQLKTSIGNTTLRDFLKDLVIDTDGFATASNLGRIQGRWLKR